MSLITNIVSYWKLDAASGNASDSVGSNTLTNNNSTAYNAGKINNGATFVSASSNFFSITDAAQSGLDLGSACSFSFWLKPTAANDYFIIGKYTTAGNQRSYIVYFNHGAMQLFVSTDGTAGASSDQGYTVTLVNGTWTHLVVTLNSGGTATFYQDGASLGTKSGYGTPFNATSDFTLGEANSQAFMDGMLDEIGIWSRELSSSEVTSLYNSGTGLSYPFGISAVNSSFLEFF